MNRTELLEALRRALPVRTGRARLGEGNVGLVVVDVVRGFTEEGPLSDPASMEPMVRAIRDLVPMLDEKLGDRLHLLVLRDTHPPDIPEPPYPPHCIRGTGEDDLDPDLGFLLTGRSRTTIIDKDCINGFVGATRRAGNGGKLWRNLLAEWVVDSAITSLVVVGDCTDICVSDLTVALLSARNHGLLTREDPRDRERYAAAVTGLRIYVYAPACATYHLDPDGPLPDGQETARHPGPIAHHVGLWTAASRGASVVDGFDF